MSGYTNKRIFIIRQSGVLPSDYNEPKEWREVIQLRMLLADYQVELWTSSFDHYSLQRRRRKDWDLSNHVSIIDSPGYRKTVSMMRVVDAWVFSLKLAVKIFTTVKKNDSLIVSVPTPESGFVSVICSKLVGCECLIDVRDNWPENFMGSGFLKRAFSFYVNFLNRVVFRFADKIIWMSDGLKENHSKRGLGNNVKQITIPVPYTYKADALVNSDVFSTILEKPVISFFGTLNEQFDLTILSNLLNESILHKKFNFVVAGDGNLFEELKAKFSVFDNVFMLGRIPFEQVAQLSRSSQAFFLFYRKPEVYHNHLTNKFMEYLEFQKPIIHNLNTSIFTLNGKSYQLGCSVIDFDFDSLLKSILEERHHNYFQLNSLSELKDATTKERFYDLLTRIIE
jgi:hypothetical protein